MNFRANYGMVFAIVCAVVAICPEFYAQAQVSTGSTVFNLQNSQAADAILPVGGDTIPDKYQARPQTSTVGGTDLRTELQAGQEGRGDSREVREEGSTQSKKRKELPPDPPTEFQEIVQNSTGHSLSIYGASMFHDVPSTFAPLDGVPVTPGYVIGPGDELLLQVWGQISLNMSLTVDRAGNIYIPQIGTLRVAGISFEKLEVYLKDQMGRVFRNFELNVNMGQLRSIQIFVLGQARRPGSYTISSLSTLVDALFVTGGPTPQGSLRHIELKRTGKAIADFDLYDLLQRGDKSGDMQLLPGDVIYIPPVGAQVGVAGSVNNPAIYELKSELKSEGATVGDALGLAGGATNAAADEYARLERVDRHHARSITQLALDTAGLAIPLRDGDIVEVEAIVDSFSNGVTLRGNVANPGRYTWKPGMRVGELFPDKEALITRDYWSRRGQMGQPVLSYVPACAASAAPGVSPGSAEPCSSLEAKPASLINSAREAGPRDLSSQSKSGQSAAASVGAASIAGRDNQRFEPRNDIVLNEPDIDWSYAAIERQSKQTLATSLLPFNLGRLVLEGDSSQDIELEPGDVITIFSKADISVPQSQQTRLVYLEGEFVSSGVYSVLPGETLRQLVGRAGGLSPDAYLYGSEFTRESTRRIQQRRLNEYINQIQTRASVNPDRSSLMDRDTALQTAHGESLAESLRELRPNGRIVFDLRPETNEVAQIPSISLEDGDRFVVPQVPSMVSVAGAVYNPNSFLYDAHRRVGSYLGIAGGTNRDADASRAFVIRADGSVVSRQQLSALHRGSFDALPVFPGDTIVVPINLNKGATLRTVVDLSQIAGQVGLALAAAKLVF